jgi:hypothetical protein
MKSRWRLPVKFWAASRNVANDCITEHLLAFLSSLEERQLPVALPLLFSAWGFIFSQVPNCVKALYVHLPWHADGVAGTSPGLYTGLKAQQEGITGFLV